MPDKLKPVLHTLPCWGHWCAENSPPPKYLVIEPLDRAIRGLINGAATDGLQSVIVNLNSVLIR